MATESWSTVIAHTSDATFRDWGSELSGKFASAGLVQTADTGQINWASVSRPGTSTNAGYEIWRFDDSLQGSSPIYLKISYGTGTASTQPRIQVQLGTGSDGSGNLTGTTTSTNTVSATIGPASTAVAYQSYLCVTEGFVGLVFKVSGASSSGGGLCVAAFMVCRSCDSDGTPNGDAAFILRHNTQGNNSAVGTNQSVDLANGTAFTSTSHPAAFVPGAESSSLVGVDVQAHLFFMIKRQVAPVFGLCTTYQSEITPGSTFAATLIGSTPRTYLQVGTQTGVQWSAASTSSMGLCMLWE